RLQDREGGLTRDGTAFRVSLSHQHAKGSLPQALLGQERLTEARSGGILCLWLTQQVLYLGYLDALLHFIPEPSAILGIGVIGLALHHALRPVRHRDPIFPLKEEGLRDHVASDLQ